MALTLIRSTESGDLYAVEYAAGTSTVDLAAGVADRRVSILSGTLLVSAAATVQLLEETSGTALSGKFELPSAAEWAIQADRSYRSGTNGKGIQISRSASVALSGEVLVSQ